MLNPKELWNVNAPTTGLRPSKSAPCSPVKPIARTLSESFHVAHKVPLGDTPYVKAKRVQLVDKDPERAIAMFWAAINAGDRVDSALKDMAIVMKQQNRAEEAIEAIKSLRHRCSDQSQESLDNILLDLYKRCGRLDDQVALLKHKLHLIQKGLAFNGKRTKTARSQGRKFQVSVDQEATRLLGNLGWALMQKENYVEAEKAYRSALAVGADNNKMCNLGICLMKQGRIGEARETLKQVRPAVADSLRGADSHLKAFERAQEMLRDLESKLLCNVGQDHTWLFEAFLGSSSIWQPHPCIDYPVQRDREQDQFANENLAMSNNRGGLLLSSNSLNIDAPPFYSSKLTKETAFGGGGGGVHCQQFHDPMMKLKRTRSGNVVEKSSVPIMEEDIIRNRRKSLCFEKAGEKWPELPDNNAFDEAIVAAVLAPLLEDEISEAIKDRRQALSAEEKGKRLRVFQDITLALNSPKAKISA